jgi:hypothetical protein
MLFWGVDFRVEILEIGEGKRQETGDRRQETRENGLTRSSWSGPDYAKRNRKTINLKPETRNQQN